MAENNNENHNKLSYEEALRNLEEIIQEMESGDLDLDESIKKFEKGLGLIRECESHLSRAEGKIKKLLSDSDTSFSEELLGTLEEYLTYEE
ncbi:MAG: exodeoxyribonuclease VII small subunit [Chitinivibrionales bacterium]